MSDFIYSAAQCRALDIASREDLALSGYPLMCRAGQAAFDYFVERWPEAKKLLVLCGGGNNGGDGWVVARLAHRAGLAVAVVSLVDPVSLSGEASEAYADAMAAGVMQLPLEAVHLMQADVVVDALLGTGFSG